MTTDTIVKTESDTNAIEETSKFTLTVLMAMTALIGLWGAACLVGGLYSAGLTGLAKGFLTAITGI